MQIICQILCLLVSFRRSIGRVVMHLTFTLPILDKMYELHSTLVLRIPHQNLKFDIQHQQQQQGQCCPGSARPPTV